MSGRLSNSTLEQIRKTYAETQSVWETARRCDVNEVDVVRVLGLY